MKPTRRHILQSSTLLLATPAMRAQPTAPPDPSAIPSLVMLFSETESRRLKRTAESWQAPGTEVKTVSGNGMLRVSLKTSETPTRLHLRWSGTVPEGLLFLSDAWERSYGDLAFRGMEPERILPWYVLATDGSATMAFGVAVAACAFCFWQIDPEGISLWCDLRSGGRAVQLGSRELNVCEIVARSYTGHSPFEAAQDFCSLLSPHPRLPKAPVYGGNNWYYAYGHSSAIDILADSERISSVAGSTSNRPWMVIDDGWAPNPTAGPWRTGNAKFPDMPKLAGDMRKAGVRPGIWMRPLFTRDPIPAKAQLRPFTLDPTVPEAAAQIQQDLRTVIGWGYELVKHDFSTFDLLGQWGFQMNAEITNPAWNFHDRTRTNAEIIRDFYTLLRTAAGETPLLGCNTVGHLSAGLFELQRTGDDTSGRDFNRTRKMGVNTLAFRMPQHNHFFAIDADCVGLTNQIDWQFNRQWLDLLARSGTPLFVSISPDALGAEQRTAIREAFALASEVQPVAEPLDWLKSNQPRQWRAQGRTLAYDWYGAEGASPFVR